MGLRERGSEGGLGGVEGREPAVRVYCMREEKLPEEKKVKVILYSSPGN